MFGCPKLNCMWERIWGMNFIDSTRAVSGLEAKEATSPLWITRRCRVPALILLNLRSATDVSRKEQLAHVQAIVFDDTCME
jgi:hypothetical protein